MRFASLPRWVPLSASVASVLIGVALIVWTFSIIAMTLTEANEPVDAEGLEARYGTINKEALDRLEPRLSPPAAQE